ncbi:MAG: hypothetical protein HY351_05065 [Candidatus Omnitrophica bacterium]|nr:hypothetical protein [Candidatus Omnitrophota bacterium]
MLKPFLLLKWLAVLLLVVQCLGCAAFLEDYNYNPVGTSQPSSSSRY